MEKIGTFGKITFSITEKVEDKAIGQSSSSSANVEKTTTEMREEFEGWIDCADVINLDLIFPNA